MLEQTMLESPLIRDARNTLDRKWRSRGMLVSGTLSKFVLKMPSKGFGPDKSTDVYSPPPCPSTNWGASPPPCRSHVCNHNHLD